MNGTAESVSTWDHLTTALAAVRSQMPEPPELAIVAGSGLGAIGERVTGATRIPYSAIPHMPTPRVKGHAGELVLGRVGGCRVAVLSGRVHAYEGHPLDDVVFGVRLLARLGAPVALLTNAAGGIRPAFVPGTLCRITDHLNFTGQNPLVGLNDERLGPRFPDMSRAYCLDLGARLEAVAKVRGIALQRGVYAGMRGPSYETPAEVHMLDVLGASVVGMSTVPETIALQHMGVRVVGISVVSNLASGVGTEPLDHSEVKEVANEAGPRLLDLVEGFASSVAQGGEA